MESEEFNFSRALGLSESKAKELMEVLQKPPYDYSLIGLKSFILAGIDIRTLL